MFSVKTETKKVEVKVISAVYTKSKINELIRADAEKQSIAVSKIVWNGNNTMTVEGKPTTEKKRKELEKEASGEAGD